MSPVKLQGPKSAGMLHEVKLVINAREDFSNSLGGGFKIHPGDSWMYPVGPLGKSLYKPYIVDIYALIIIPKNP